MNVRNEAGEPRVTVRAAFDPLQVEDLSGLAPARGPRRCGLKPRRTRVTPST